MLSQETHQKIYFWALAYLFFSVPFMSKWLPFTIGIVVLALNFLAEENLFSKLKKAIRTPWVLLFILFYVLHLISVAYSTNISEANRDLFLKLPLLIIPTALSFISLSKSQKQILYSIWIVVTVIAACLLLGQAYINYADTGHVKYWFYTALAGGKHPAYFSMYCITAIILLLQGKFEKWKALPLMLLLLMVFLLSSRMQIVVLFLLVIGFFIQQIVRSEIKIVVVLSMLFTFFVTILVLEGSFIKNTRITKLYADTNSLFSADDTSIRVMIWESSVDVLEGNWLIGFGTGSENEALNQYLKTKVTLTNTQEKEKFEKLSKNKPFMERINKNKTDHAKALETYVLWSLRKHSSNPYDKFYKHYYNYHNQFLQSWAASGILCLLILLGIFFVSLKMGIQHKDFTLLAIAFLIAMSFMSESMLERQYGVIYFALILPIMMLKSRKSV